MSGSAKNITTSTIVPADYLLSVVNKNMIQLDTHTAFTSPRIAARPFRQVLMIDLEFNKFHARRGPDAND